MFDKKSIFKQFKQTLHKLCPCCHNEHGQKNFVKMHTLKDKDTSFALIAVRCNSGSATVRRKLEMGRTYQLLQGYTISEDQIVISEERIIANQLYDDYANEGLNSIPHVQFSAIVGKNGSGKSSLIEFLMRMINNAATIIKGEMDSEPASDRLHFVEDVDGDLWYAMNGKCYQLTVKPNASLYIKVYENSENAGIFTLQSEDRIEQQHRLDEVLPSHDENARKILSKLFYTLVSNYSIYAYNTNDFKQECCSNEKERVIRGGNADEIYPSEEKCWLHGLFHKNDGYHIPLNITPFRSRGNIDINVENQLARERLISLLITQDQYRTINDHLHATGMKVIPCRKDKYGFNAIKTKLFFKEMDESTYLRMRKEITELWGKTIDKDLSKFNINNPLYELALDYLAYKTLKVSKQYKQHNKFYRSTYISTTYDVNLLKELVEGESKDHSHITRKIFQTLAFIVLPVYNLSVKGGNIEDNIPFEGLAGKWHSDAVKGNLGELTRNRAHMLNSAIVPPPFYTYDILLKDNSSDDTILFSTLSSGEKQQIYAISSILYHLDNLNSVADDNSNQERVKYPHVNIILEEIELYFHPEMQRRFVYDLLRGVQSMRLEYLKGINFILVTHSPYVLSDIPSINVLALGSNTIEGRHVHSFGANIHEMLKTSFFLENGTEGMFARWEFSHIMACLLIHRWAMCEEFDCKNYQEVMASEAFEVINRYLTIDMNDKKKCFEYPIFDEELGKKQLLQRINLIDEPVMRQALMSEFNKTFNL